MTLDEMARELGVSKSTVSRALSGKGRIGEATRERIVQYARGRNDLRETTAGKPEMTKNLGVILPADVYLNGGPYFQECILGICETAAFLNYDVLIATGTANDVSGIRTLVEKNKVDGIILLRSLEDDKALRYLTEVGFPVGLTGVCANERVIQVDTDNEAAAESLTALLIGKGYRRFAFVIDDMEFRVNRSRYRGFEKALEKSGVSMEKQTIISGPLRVDMLDSVLEDLIARKVECVICGDDVICTRVMSSLQSEGYRIPMDVAVASLYNSPNLDCISPSVTAVNVSARQVGNMISKQMIAALEGKEFEKKTTMDYEILMRKSTGQRRDT